jgi:predicted DNA binding CopG/RHH family protein
MASKKQRALSRRGPRTVKSEAPIPDKDIDYSDIPESSDEELKRATRVGRPKASHTKQLIAIRLDPNLINRLKKIAKFQDKPYQTLIHELLEKATQRAA